MSDPDETRLLQFQEEERIAQKAAKRGDYSKMVALLRKLHQPYEVPDLWFIADLLENKPIKRAGRPPGEKISSGLRALKAAQMVCDLIQKRGLTIETAAEEASKVLPMSESAIKKHYLNALKSKMLASQKKSKF